MSVVVRAPRTSKRTETDTSRGDELTRGDTAMVLD